MSIAVRPAEVTDLDTVVDLLIADAMRRQETDPLFWKVKADPRAKVLPLVRAFLAAESRRVYQELLLAEADGGVVGIANVLVLPVPPIYAGGSLGPPGIILEACFVTDDAPEGTYQALVEAAETDLRRAGAETLLAQSAAGGDLEREYVRRGYEPLTLYLAKTRLRKASGSPAIRKANDDDIANIVTASAEHRRILNHLNVFWKPSDAADTHFANWMRKSLTLDDRDMFVCESDDAFHGYAIAQPATHLHFPLPHDIGAIGVIDDFYHVDLRDPSALPEETTCGAELFRAAEAALEARGYDAAFAVCPAAWTSKTALLEAAGYRNAMTWLKKR
ncbi:hypothetical protein [Oricola sp.]|uniref:hypothetical protein n=1 Tax=Oricola sp. TaxID=1979950 RepID=UPI003BAC8853